MLKLCTLLISLSLAITSPQNDTEDTLIPHTRLKHKADFVDSQPYVVKSVKWLENTPLNQNEKLHGQVRSFLFAWMEGAGNVHVTVLSDIVDITNNYTLLIIYMGECALYDLDHPDAPNQTQGALQGIRAMIKVYNKKQGVTTDSNIENLISLDSKGQLDQFVADKFAPKKKKH